LCQPSFCMCMCTLPISVTLRVIITPTIVFFNEKNFLCAHMHMFYEPHIHQHAHASTCKHTHTHTHGDAVGVPHAIGFVIMSSVVLVLLFYFIRDIIIFVIGMYCIAAASALTTVFAPLVERLSPRLAREVLKCLPVSRVLASQASFVKFMWRFTREFGDDSFKVLYVFPCMPSYAYVCVHVHAHTSSHIHTN
jgi:hypothetical protein